MIISQKNAIVTGASRGLGAALASALVAKGATVYGLARNAQALKALQEKMGRMFIPVELDITDPKAVASWVEDTFSDQHAPDILINNAGAGYLSNIDALSLEQWHQMINTNLNGTFYMTSKVVSLMKENQGGSSRRQSGQQD